jgi:hypothetical protein
MTSLTPDNRLARLLGVFVTACAVLAGTFVRRLFMAACTAAMVASFGVPSAEAYRGDEIGLKRSPDVSCNPITNTISVQGGFGAGTAYTYTSQSLSVRYWMYDVDNKISFWLSRNGNWTSFVHKPWDGYSYTPWAPNVPVWEGRIIVAPEKYGYHRFEVYAEYAWWTSTGWVTSTGHKTTCYL